MHLVLASEQTPGEDAKTLGERSEPTRAKLKNLESEAIEVSFSLARSPFAG